AVLEVTQAGAAVFFLDRHAVKAERAKPRPEIARELVGPVDLGGTRRDLIRREIADRLADRIGGLAEIKVESIGDGHAKLLPAQPKGRSRFAPKRPCHGEMTERRASATVSRGSSQRPSHLQQSSPLQVLNDVRVYFRCPAVAEKALQ